MNVPLELAELESKTDAELQQLAREMLGTAPDDLDKHELAVKILQAQGEQEGQMVAEGVLEILPEGWGFLRVGMNFAPNSKDIYVSQSQIKRFGLKTGDSVLGYVRPPKEGTPERYLSLLRVEAINGDPPDVARGRIQFDDLTPIYPVERLRMETTAKNTSGRFMDIVAPIGK